MPRDFLHNHPQFADLIRIVAEERGISPALVEKDYWIMHCLYGLQQMGSLLLDCFACARNDAERLAENSRRHCEEPLRRSNPGFRCGPWIASLALAMTLRG
jgi:hypothetical protein